MKRRALISSLLGIVIGFFYGALRPPARLAADGLDGGCTPCACRAPIPDHAYVATNGSDDAGNGSLDCPFATPQKAIAVLTAMLDGGVEPFDKASYERPRVLSIIGPGTFAGDLEVPTLAALVVELGPHVTMSGRVHMTIIGAKKFGSTKAPTLYVEGPQNREVVRLGNLAEAIVVTVDAGAPVSSAAVIGSMSLAGALNAKENNGSVILRDVSISMTKPDSGVHSINAPGWVFKSYDSQFNRQLYVNELQYVSRNHFFDEIQYIQGGSDFTKGTYGFHDSTFSKPASGVKCIRTGGPMRIDEATDYHASTANFVWCFTSNQLDAGVLQLISSSTFPPHYPDGGL